ncbi:hypothetical protein QR46_2267 [Giardia duodenalis assemblage B]|uniref:Uncharacterized protein n=1 Tax=Giardia duodenalis assemblage B TaxID=1394984 RepID=A0A132NVN7_GIAIN|nr:hypothetical protein QR46_2267 [Giardia intestinalis assemblage B]
MSLDVLEMNGLDSMEQRGSQLILKSLGEEGYIRFTISTYTKLKVLIGTEVLKSLTVCVNDVYQELDYYRPEVKDGFSSFEIVTPSRATIGIYFCQYIG